VLRQSWLPGFPEGAQKVGEALAILEGDEQVTYFVGGDTYFTHPVGDDASRRFAVRRASRGCRLRSPDLYGPGWGFVIEDRPTVLWERQ
jgi:hypothetical protein